MNRLSSPRGAGLLLTLLAAAAARAESPDSAAAPAPAVRLAQAPTGSALGFAAGQLGQERIVKGAPYCADAVHETVQWLPDPAGGAANRIVRTQTTRLCRDGEGRTRQELERDGRKLVYLRDPVAGESWVLDADRRSARPLAGTAHAIDDASWREYGQRLREWSRGLAERIRAAGPGAAASPPPPMPPVPAFVSREPAAASGAAPEAAREPQVRILKLDHLPSAGWTPPEVAAGWRQFAPRGPGVASPLGQQEIEGLRVHGERTTWTIEAGKLGNEKPIVTVRDVWTSPELMLTVSSRDFDPRSGEVNYRLQNLRRGEPDPVLMRVPSDYSVPRRVERKTG